MGILRSSREGGDAGGVSDAVGAVVDPRLFYPLKALGTVRSVELRRRSTTVELAVPSAGHPDGAGLVRAVGEAVVGAGGAPPDVRLVPMTEEEERSLVARLHELDAPGPAAGPARPAGGPAARPSPLAAKGSPTRVLAIGSGKGGVGKSSVTVNLAVALAGLGHSVALLDADVYGFSVPSMLGIEEQPRVLGDLMLPPVAWGVRCISIGFFVPEDQAVVWRGPMLHKALEQFLVDVHWGGPDYLLIDLPPGTGDVALSISQFLPAAELFVVTTPQPAAERVAQRSAVLARQLRMPLRGVIENMSYFRGDDGTRYELFGSGGGEALASSLGVSLLAQLPFVPALREGGDSGRPVAGADPGSEAGVELRRLAETVAGMGPAKVYRSELTIRDGGGGGPAAR